MALYDDLVRDASYDGGLFRFEEVTVVEGAAWRIELPHTATALFVLDDGSAFDFSVLTSVTAKVIDSRETVLLSLTWEPHVGWFALTATGAATAGLAGSEGLNAKTRDGLNFAVRGTLPDGRVVQVVDARSALRVQQQGV